MTGAIGLTENDRQAEEILQKGRADIVLVGRDMLKDPLGARAAADHLRTPIDVSPQYTCYGSASQRSQPAIPASLLCVKRSVHEPNLTKKAGHARPWGFPTVTGWILVTILSNLFFCILDYFSCGKNLLLLFGFVYEHQSSESACEHLKL